MYQNLEDYLNEISHYLAVKEGSGEILSEIRSHILEKTEEKFGSVTEEEVGKVILTYGLPRQVAAKYLDDVEIVSPSLKRYLFFYTGILFFCHSAMASLAYLLKISMLSFPFLYIPSMDVWQFLAYLPMAFVYDLGLVVIVLYFVTQRNNETRLPWPKLFSIRTSQNGLKKPKVAFLIFILLAFTTLLYFFIRYGAIFFVSMNDPAHPVPLFGPDASTYFSILFLSMLACEAAGYALRFINLSRWLDLIRVSVILFLLQFVWNAPMKVDFPKIHCVDVQFTAMIFLLIFTIHIAFRFLKNLISIIHK